MNSITMLDLILGKDIASYIRRHRGMVWCTIILTALSSLFVVIPAYLLQPFVDQGMKTGTTPVSWKIPWIAFEEGSWLSWHRTELVLVEGISPNNLLILLAGVAFCAILLKSITFYLSGVSATAFSNRAVKSLRIDLFRKFVSLPLSFHKRQKSGELVARATADLSLMQNLISKIVMGFIQNPLSAAAFLIYLLIMNYQLTLIVLIGGPLIVGLIRLFGKKVKRHSKKLQDATADVTSAYQETLLCLKVIHGYFRGDYEVDRFEKLADYLYKRVMRWNFWRLGMGPILDVTVFLSMPALLIAGKIYFHHTLGELLSMIYAFARLYIPTKKLAKEFTSLRTLQGATRRVFEIMRTVPEIKDRVRAKVLPRHKDSIVFDRVSFGYYPNELILKDISFHIKAGEMVAFVGSTGAGKSTLLDLIPRFFDVTSGKITIDGIDIRDVTLESLRKQIGIVGQEVLLFHDTIANNIRYGDPGKDMEEVIRAAKAAYAHNFILAQPKGYDTVIGDQGTLLSGGQRQRIAIARALLIDPAILILDEAASALDAESEIMIQKAIERIRGEHTILIVTHRLSTIMKANNIYVVEEGKILESGTKENLLASNGRFRQLYDMQFEPQISLQEKM